MITPVQIVLDAIDEHLHGDTSGAGEAAAAAVEALTAAGHLPPAAPDGEQPRTAGLLIEVVPVGQPGRVRYRVRNVGPIELQPIERVRVLIAVARNHMAQLGLGDDHPGTDDVPRVDNHD